MEFGNWEVTESSIEWRGGGLGRFSIPLNQMDELRHNKTGNLVFYEWILLATEEDWLTQNDLFDMNYAFVYGAAKAGVNFNFEIFDATLEEQFDRFDMEDNEDFEL